ncbi:MAG: plastocyanin/azurin family copper-binding protein [Chloroflexota bacterium]
MYPSCMHMVIAFLLAQLIISCRPSITTTSVNASIADIAAIAITIQDNYYGNSNSNLDDPPAWTVAPNANIIATVQNMGELTHNWVVVKLGATVPIPFDEGQSSDIIFYGAGMVYGQNQTTLTFTAPGELGEYLVICTVPGHYPSMQGRLIVE